MKSTNLVLEPLHNIGKPHPNLDYSNKQKGPWFENTLSNPNLLKYPKEKIWAIHAEGELSEIFSYDYLSIVEGDMPSEYGVYAVKVNLEGYSRPENQIVDCHMLFNRIQGSIRGIVHLLNEPLDMDEIDDPKIHEELVRSFAKAKADDLAFTQYLKAKRKKST